MEQECNRDWNAGVDDEETAADEEATELPPNDASSRHSDEWGEGLDDKEAPAEERPDADEALDADESSEHDEAHLDQLGAIGFALAKSSALLPEFQTRAHSRNCIDAAWMKPMTGTCTEEDKDNLNNCMDLFFTRRPVLQSTPPKEDKDKAVVLKTSAEIEHAWRTIFERRRLG